MENSGIAAQWRKARPDVTDRAVSRRDQTHEVAREASEKPKPRLASTAGLLTSGWTVIRLWETEIERDVASAVDLVVEAFSKSATPSPASCIADRHAAEFFAGIGLARVALEDAGWHVRYANDNAEKKVLFYKENLGPGGTAPTHGTSTKLLRQMFRQWRSRPHAFLAQTCPSPALNAVWSPAPNHLHTSSSQRFSGR